MVILLMGVTGSGKTTVGRALAESLHWQFVDADDFHPPENVAKMRAGIPLNDADRAPWLAVLREQIAKWLRARTDTVLACSALKQAYREQLMTDPQVKLVYLRGDQGVIAQRLSQRRDHYMEPGLLPSQLAALEEPGNALVVDVRAGVSDIVGRIRSQLGV
ncbi:MAG TPA: gluconokinase [Candidatus Eisenbacteria bacterium]|nr:gluconokinase [Candidatus Eisenbacteria bacterium]